MINFIFSITKKEKKNQQQTSHTKVLNNNKLHFNAYLHCLSIVRSPNGTKAVRMRDYQIKLQQFL